MVIWVFVPPHQCSSAIDLFQCRSKSAYVPTGHVNAVLPNETCGQSSIDTITRLVLPFNTMNWVFVPPHQCPSHIDLFQCRSKSAYVPTGHINAVLPDEICFQLSIDTITRLVLPFNTMNWVFVPSHRGTVCFYFGPISNKMSMYGQPPYICTAGLEILSPFRCEYQIRITGLPICMLCAAC